MVSPCGHRLAPRVSGRKLPATLTLRSPTPRCLFYSQGNGLSVFGVCTLRWMDLIVHEKVRYAVWGVEICPTTGKQHVQGYVAFKVNVRFNKMQKLFPGDHLEIAKGGDLENKAYCHKLAPHPVQEHFDGRDLFEWGVPEEKHQGKRSDCHEIVDLVLKGASTLDIVRKVPTALRQLQNISRLRSLLDAEILPSKPILELRPWQVSCLEWLNGPVIPRRIGWVWSCTSSTGKSTFGRLVSLTLPSLLISGATKMCDLIFAYRPGVTKVIIFDMSRSEPLDALFSSILETLSNGGQVLSTKYEPCVKCVDAHILVLCNRAPIWDRLPNRIRDWCLDEMPGVIDENVVFA